MGYVNFYHGQLFFNALLYSMSLSRFVAFNTDPFYTNSIVGISVSAV